jgi:hypothetical protein
LWGISSPPKPLALCFGTDSFGGKVFNPAVENGIHKELS